jgi:hypothetical protein
MNHPIRSSISDALCKRMQAVEIRNRNRFKKCQNLRKSDSTFSLQFGLDSRRHPWNPHAHIYPISFYYQEAYNSLTVEMKVTLLLRAIQNPVNTEDSQIMAAVLLRRVFSSDFQEFFPKVVTN